MALAWPENWKFFKLDNCQRNSPKIGLAMLSAMDADVNHGYASGDANLLTGIPGIGKDSRTNCPGA
jgi:Holliday junction resolvasome RuvABC DNA-binding subunit